MIPEKRSWWKDLGLLLAAELVRNFSANLADKLVSKLVKQPLSPQERYLRRVAEALERLEGPPPTEQHRLIHPPQSVLLEDTQRASNSHRLATRRSRLRRKK